jgi:hypothetical protein
VVMTGLKHCLGPPVLAVGLAHEALVKMEGESR